MVYLPAFLCSYLFCKPSYYQRLQANCFWNWCTLFPNHFLTLILSSLLVVVPNLNCSSWFLYSYIVNRTTRLNWLVCAYYFILFIRPGEGLYVFMYKTFTHEVYFLFTRARPTKSIIIKIKSSIMIDKW